MTRRTCTAGGGGDSSGVEGDEVSGSDLPLLGWSLLHHYKAVALVPTWGLPSANLHPARQLLLGRAGASKEGPHPPLSRKDL